SSTSCAPGKRPAIEMIAIASAGVASWSVIGLLVPARCSLRGMLAARIGGRQGCVGTMASSRQPPPDLFHWAVPGGNPDPAATTRRVVLTYQRRGGRVTSVDVDVRTTAIARVRMTIDAQSTELLLKLERTN